MAKQGQHQPNEASKRTQGREQAVADGGSTRSSKPRSGRSGSDSNASSGARDQQAAPGSRERTPQNRAQSERTIKANDQVEGKGASGAPQGGQIDGRQGDQEGQRR